MDPTKVTAIESWPHPRTVRALRRFLDLAKYYRNSLLFMDAHEMGHDYMKVLKRLFIASDHHFIMLT